MKRIAAPLLGLAVLSPGGATWAESMSPERSAGPGSHAAGSIAGTLLYTPLKAGLCLTGGIASGFAFLSSGSSAARAVADASCKGRWILTRNALKGTEPLGFVGEIDVTPER
jgi:hypothetical protein